MKGDHGASRCRGTVRPTRPLSMTRVFQSGYLLVAFSSGWRTSLSDALTVAFRIVYIQADK
jgi:hypothetical protein